MPNCTIELSKSDMKMLLMYVYFGDWILTATKDHPNLKYEGFYQKILSLMKNNNIEQRIEFENGMYEITTELEEEYNKYIDDYNEETFWEELIEKLARRDLFGKYEKNDIEKMDYISINEKIDKEADKYVKEIDRNGIKNIGIIK